MAYDSLFETSWLPLLPCYSWAGLLVWLLLAVGVIALLVTLFRESRNR
jgi:hypothetical protein